MNLTKSLKWAMVCAGITALSASAAPWVEETFDIPGGNIGDPMIGFADWSSVGSGGADASVIAAANAARGQYKGATPLEGQDGLVLALNTEGAKLVRDLSQLGVDFSSAPVYIDLMVQFEMSEDQPPAPDVGVKALIYADAASSNVVAYMGDYSGAKYWVPLDGVKIDKEQWYRLTLTWIDLAGSGSAAFSVTVNGIELTEDTGFGCNDEFNNQVWDPGAVGPFKWFGSAANEASIWDPTGGIISSIEFEGTGFIDELVVTDVDPYITQSFFAGDTTKPVNTTDYNNWQAKNSTAITAAGGVKGWMWNAFLLDVVSSNNGATDAKLVIKSIKPTSTGVKITLEAVDGVGGKHAFPKNTNGTLKISRGATLGSWSVESYTVSSGEYEILGVSDKYFFKATVE